MKVLVQLLDFLAVQHCHHPRLREVAFIFNRPPGPREEVTTADVSPSPSLDHDAHGKDFGPDPNKQELNFEGIDRKVVDWNGHIGARVSGDPGAFPAAAHDVKLFAEVPAELLGEETVNDRV